MQCRKRVSVPPPDTRAYWGQILIDLSIVFSFWTKTLDQIGDALTSRGMNYVRLDGSLSGAARSKVVQTFHNDAEVKTLLMTTGAGSVG